MSSWKSGAGDNPYQPVVNLKCPDETDMEIVLASKISVDPRQSTGNEIFDINLIIFDACSGVIFPAEFNTPTSSAPTSINECFH